LPGGRLFGSNTFLLYEKAKITQKGGAYSGESAYSRGGAYLGKYGTSKETIKKIHILNYD
jgi:hypothetical protein